MSTSYFSIENVVKEAIIYIFYNNAAEIKRRNLEINDVTCYKLLKSYIL